MKRALPLLFGAVCACGETAAPPPATPSPELTYYLATNPIRTPLRALEPGFGVAGVRERQMAGERLVRTSRGEEIALADLQVVAPFTFRGSNIVDGRFDFGWVVEPHAPVWSSPDAGGRIVEGHHEFERVVTTSEPAPPDWVRVPAGFMKRAHLRLPRAASRPGLVGPTERWLDVDTESETLVAYEGDRPLFATLVSTGTGAPGAPFSTPRGAFHVYARSPRAKMDNLDHPNVPHYSFDEVPWVQFFKQEIALHAAFWHRRFGRPVSHGCVNVPPRDAERLYELTKIGTVVRVR